jgi:hypothetical protein
MGLSNADQGGIVSFTAAGVHRQIASPIAGVSAAIL